MGSNQQQLKVMIAQLVVAADDLSRRLSNDTELLVELCAERVMWAVFKSSGSTGELAALAGRSSFTHPIFLRHRHSQRFGYSLVWVRCRHEMSGKGRLRKLPMAKGASAVSKKRLIETTPEALQAIVAGIEEQAIPLRATNLWLLKLRATLRDVPEYAISERDFGD